MPTREEIVKALRCETCVTYDCPYYDVRWRDCNYRILTTDAADLIEQQERQIKQLTESLLLANVNFAHVKRERDTAIADLKDSECCDACANEGEDPGCDWDCQNCNAQCACYKCKKGSMFRWRGVKEGADER